MRTLSVLLFITFLFACSGDNEKSQPIVTADNKTALAVYKGGTITEKDVQDWMQANLFEERRMAKVLENNKMLRGHAKRIALERFAAKEAEENGFSDSAMSKEAARHAKKKYLIDTARMHNRRGATYSKDCIKVSMIKLTVEDYQLIDGVKKVKLPEDEIEKKFQTQEEVARSVIAKLKQGSDFPALAREYSDDPSGPNGGDIGYIYNKMRDEAFSEAVFALKPGEFSTKPVRAKGGVYVIKNEDRQTITNKNIWEVVADQRNARHLDVRFRILAAVEYESGLDFADDAESYYQNLRRNDPQTVLFQIGTDDFKVSDFDRQLTDSEASIGGQEFREQLKLHDAVLLRDAFQRGIHQDPAFVEGWKTVKVIALANEYKYAVVLDFSNIEVSDDDIDREIEFRKTQQSQGAAAQTSRDDIRKILKGKKRFAKKYAWEEALLRKNKFKLY